MDDQCVKWVSPRVGQRAEAVGERARHRLGRKFIPKARLVPERGLPLCR